MATIQLPHLFIDRFNLLKQRFPCINDSIINDISKCKNICYLVDKPIFTITYLVNNEDLNSIEKSGVSTGCQNIYAESISIQSVIKSFSPGKVYYLYNIISDGYSIYLRGNWVDDYYEIRQKFRESQINSIFDE